ncbi:hypothetical protein [Fibrella aquatica]|uniref:hypothetical protein n=1 Tax=Fibrella aquatica TaxID=3242487 RepID=UPI0035214925
MSYQKKEALCAYAETRQNKSKRSLFGAETGFVERYHSLHAGKFVSWIDCQMESIWIVDQVVLPIGVAFPDDYRLMVVPKNKPAFEQPQAPETVTQSSTLPACTQIEGSTAPGNKVTDRRKRAEHVCPESISMLNQPD